MNFASESQRVALPEIGQTFVTDAGLETELVFHDGIDLPEFCSATLLDSTAGRARLRVYYSGFVRLAAEQGCGVLLETPTWRLNTDWAYRVGLDEADRRRVNFSAVQMLQDLRHEAGFPAGRFIVSGNIGPRFDGYKADQLMEPSEAARYHSDQIRALRDAGADCVSAMTITNSGEATGIALAAGDAEMPTVISFTVETDGRLPSGEDLGTAIETVDHQSNSSVSYFGLNCAHPEHFQSVLERNESWVSRIGSIRANASKMSHEELDNATELDAGDPDQLARSYRHLKTLLPGLRVIGGCCGTDVRHVAAICQHYLSESPSR